jgi:monoamine oxidase
MSEHHEVIVVGAGLSGLYTALVLHRQGHDVLVLEARERTGGRILSLSPSSGGAAVDLGPAWVWPEFQPRLRRLLDELDIDLFPQYIEGDLLYEQAIGNVHRHGGPSSHAQSFRISGGAQALIHALVQALPEDRISLGTRVHSIAQDGVIQAERAGAAFRLNADRIVLALPPRLIGSRIELIPAPEEELLQFWRDTPTWMAGHCKLLFIYEEAFWRRQGVSGEVFSRVGPLTEIYDGSPHDESFYALTSFVGLNAAQRAQISRDQLITACMAQLERLFGMEARDCIQVLVNDWSEESFTATDADLLGPAQHPQYPENLPRSLWEGRLMLAGTEVARESGGYLEGALESADEICELIGE